MFILHKLNLLCGNNFNIMHSGFKERTFLLKLLKILTLDLEHSIVLKQVKSLLFYCQRTTFTYFHLPSYCKIFLNIIRHYE